MLGIPTENYQDALNTYELNRKIKPLYAWCSLLNPYKGTSIADIAKREGYLPESFDFAAFSSSYFGGTPLLFDKKDDMLRLQKFFSIGIFLNIPTKVASWITQNIRINFIYNILFIIFYGLLGGKLTGFTLRDILIFGLHTNTFKYFGVSKRDRKYNLLYIKKVVDFTLRKKT